MYFENVGENHMFELVFSHWKWKFWMLCWMEAKIQKDWISGRWYFSLRGKSLYFKLLHWTQSLKERLNLIKASVIAPLFGKRVKCKSLNINGYHFFYVFSMKQKVVKLMLLEPPCIAKSSFFLSTKQKSTINNTVKAAAVKHHFSVKQNNENYNVVQSDCRAASLVPHPGHLESGNHFRLQEDPCFFANSGLVRHVFPNTSRKNAVRCQRKRFPLSREMPWHFDFSLLYFFNKHNFLHLHSCVLGQFAQINFPS